MRSLRLVGALVVMGALTAGPPVVAANTAADGQSAKPAVAASNAPVSAQTQQANADTADVPAAQALLQKSSAVIRQMKADPHLKDLMTQAKGILVMPEFGHVNFIIGGRWSSGVLIADYKGQWSDPAFFAIGGGSLGDQASTLSGPVAILIMNQHVMDKFTGNGRWSLNAASGFNLVNYSPVAQTMLGKADVVVWTGINGAPANIRISINNIGFDSEYSHAMYGTMYLPAILVGKTPVSSQLALDVRNELPPPDDAPMPDAVASATSAATKGTPTAAAPKTATTATPSRAGKTG